MVFTEITGLLLYHIPVVEICQYSKIINYVLHIPEKLLCTNTRTISVFKSLRLSVGETD
jgi:hypothetical protein